MSNTITNSTCHFLFGKQTGEIFPKANYSQEFIENALETLMKINAFLISKKEALFLFDPTAFNNQCHLYALMLAQKRYDERFLHLSLFLSYAFLTDSSLLEKVGEKACKEKEISYPSPKRAFFTFLKDPQGERTRASRVALIALFESHLKSTLKDEESALYKELYLIAKMDLSLPASSGSLLVYTYPKFAGVAYMLDAVIRDRLPLLFKIKVMSEKGTGTFFYSSTPEENVCDDASVMVFEMLATDEHLTYSECREIAKRCPSHSRRHPKKTDRHPEDEACLFCTDKRIDVLPFQQRLLPAFRELDKMFYALGADFTIENQKPFHSFFKDENTFPILTELFIKAVPNIEKFSLSLHKPLNMSVSHAYTDCKERAFSETLIIDAPYEKHLNERGLI